MFAILDDSKARVRMLIAPAGYGKSTLLAILGLRRGMRAVSRARLLGVADEQ